MRQLATLAEDALDRQAAASLAAAYQRLAAANGSAVSYRFWTPAGLRTKRQRRFALLLDASGPLLVSKLPLDPDDHKVANEWATLTSLNVHKAIRHPQPIDQTGAGFIMTYAPTVDFPDAFTPADQRERVPALLNEAIDLLAAMHLASPEANSRGSNGLDVARTYIQGVDNLSASCQAALRRALIGPTHGDLAPWNIRYDKETNRLMLIDWEDYRPVGLPGIDVLNLLLTLGIVIFPAFHRFGDDWLYDQLLGSDHWYANTVRGTLVRYAALTRQPVGGVIDLLPFFCLWMIGRIEAESRDSSQFYYRAFAARYAARAPSWMADLPCD